ncbi:hypothetical protein BSKO_04906 [Bryopsis sp. KO-2023]|nr:hypothetical protein BSKO_04906 [Bryopsis sp. KO-2023]
MDGAAADLENATKNEAEERAVHDADRHSIEGGGYSSTSYFGSPSSGTSTPMRAVNTLIEGCIGQNLEIPLGLELGLGDILEKTTDVAPLPPHETQSIGDVDSSSPETSLAHPLKENTTLINGVGEALECSETDENSTSNMQSIPPQVDTSTTETEIAAEEKQTSPKMRNEFRHNWSLLEACGITPISTHERLLIAPEAPQIAAPPPKSCQSDGFAQTTAVQMLETPQPESHPSVAAVEIHLPESRPSEPEMGITRSASPTVLSVKPEKEAVLIPKEALNLMEVTGINLMDKFGSMVGELEQFAKFVQDVKAIAVQMETSGLFDSIRCLVDSHGDMIKGKASGGGIKQECAEVELGVEKLQEVKPVEDAQSVTPGQAILGEKQPHADSTNSDCTKPPGGGALVVNTPPKQALSPAMASGEDSMWDIPDILTGTGSGDSKNAESSAALSTPPLVAPAAVAAACDQGNLTPEKLVDSSTALTSVGGQSTPSNGKSDLTGVIPPNVVDQKNNPSETASKPDPPHPPGLNPPQKKLTVGEALALNPPGRTGTATNDQQPQRTNVIGGGRGPPPNWNGSRARGFRPPQGRNSQSHDGWGGGRNGSGGRRDGERVGMNRQPRDQQSWDIGWESTNVQHGVRSAGQGGREQENNNAWKTSDSRSGGDADSSHSNHSSQNRTSGLAQWGGGDGNHERRSGFNGGRGDGDRQSGWGDRGGQGNRWGGERVQGRGYSARQTQHSTSDGWGAWEPLEE